MIKKKAPPPKAIRESSEDLDAAYQARIRDDEDSRKRSRTAVADKHVEKARTPAPDPPPPRIDRMELVRSIADLLFVAASWEATDGFAKVAGTRKHAQLAFLANFVEEAKQQREGAVGKSNGFDITREDLEAAVLHRCVAETLCRFKRGDQTDADVADAISTIEVEVFGREAEGSTRVRAAWMHLQNEARQENEAREKLVTAARADTGARRRARHDKKAGRGWITVFGGHSDAAHRLLDVLGVSKRTKRYATKRLLTSGAASGAVAGDMRRRFADLELAAVGGGVSREQLVRFGMSCLGLSEAAVAAALAEQRRDPHLLHDGRPTQLLSLALGGAGPLKYGSDAKTPSKLKALVTGLPEGSPHGDLADWARHMRERRERGGAQAAAARNRPSHRRRPKR